MNRLRDRRGRRGCTLAPHFGFPCEASFHPANLPNDPPGKASNTAYAFQWLQSYLQTTGQDTTKALRASPLRLGWTKKVGYATSVVKTFQT